MGNFTSHFLGAIFLGLYGIWLSFLCASRFVILSSQKRNNLIDKNIPKRYKLYLVESLFKLCLVCIMIALEKPALKIWNSETEAIVHITAYSGVGLASIVEILIIYGYDLPPKLDMFLMNCLSYGVLGFIMITHSAFNGMLENYMHYLYVYAIIACIFFSFFEMFNPEEILFTYGKVASILLQASIVCQIAFVIHGENKTQWDPQNHETMMILAAMFCWDIFGVILFLIAQLFCIKILYRYSSRFSKLTNWLVLDDKNCENISNFNFQKYEDCIRTKLLSDESNINLEDEP